MPMMANEVLPKYANEKLMSNGFLNITESASKADSVYK